EYVRLTGHLTLADIRGRHVREWTAEHDRDRLNQMLAQCLQTGHVRNLEIDCCEPAGDRTPVELNATRLDTPDGPWILGLCRDISERRRAAAALAQKAEELARSNADLDEFAYAASHDLKGPLGMVMRHAQRLERRCGERLDAESIEHLDSIKNGVRLMDRLIRDLHTNSQVGRDTRLEPVDTAALVREVAIVLSPQIEDAGAQLSTAGLPTVVASRTDLLTVFQNLIQNAIKFREAGRPPRIDVSAERESEEWVFAFRDNGIGIDPVYSERIFKLFERLPGSADTEGTGIGLANCKKAVERRGGRIWVESQPGAGSTFYFTLPILAEAAKTFNRS
ncbi:MAG: PAS domain S-box protein, partial [Planctomycetes bacterium]|nr:PAS domain S-box protein [Planctomycetota bacterium]